MTRVGVALLPEYNPARDGRWARAEEYGFAHAWCFDHLGWRSLIDSSWHATVPTLAAAAMTTSTIGIGTFVASPNYRHPVVFGKDLMTLDHISDGRLLVGVGAGTTLHDARVLGQPDLTPRQRHDRYEEFVRLLDRLLRTPVTDARGDWYRAAGARMVPGCVQQPRPPLFAAGNGPRGMRLALTAGDGWITMGRAGHGADPESWWRGVAEATARFDDLAAELAAPAGLRRFLDMPAGGLALSSARQVRDDIGRAGELGFTDVVIAWPRPQEPYTGSETVMAELGEMLDEHGSLIC